MSIHLSQINQNFRFIFKKIISDTKNPQIFFKNIRAKTSLQTPGVDKNRRLRYNKGMKLIEKIFGNIRTVRPQTLLAAVPLTLAYPIAKALISSKNRIMIFSDSLLIISLLLIAMGVLFTVTRFGDFDITKYVFRRGTDKNAKPFAEYKKDREEERKATFNYPLFFGLIYLAVSFITAYLFC